MPRSNRPRRRPGQRGAPARAPGAGAERPPNTVRFAGTLWTVREVRGNDSGRAFRCPGCQQQVLASTPHTVAWPSQTMHGVENRRHWHTRCWAARERRKPGGSFA
ncbi:MAG TPA: hypothetical protein VJ976_08820 [Ornithinimicrobium sp.]|uniref:hypothetical protein n=1 Tax=Ornithinimicrobium sp. TaxID=1977084 RepID=UPI002B49BF7F|nr:hypothetical protein [Ornithinimicrobium sp.]HKJ12472.1 hypothetical protein [Ornithinimicrobium sp.]